MDITTISTDVLKKDLQESNDDIRICEMALIQNIKSYSGGLVEERLQSNKHFVNVISKELNRRRGENDCYKSDQS
jgi:phage tail sheath gpL-like